ncbi:hypothetical protein ACMAY8_05175 [Rhodobacteraceae bacterium nBUS_22]
MTKVGIIGGFDRKKRIRCQVVILSVLTSKSVATCFGPDIN